MVLRLCVTRDAGGTNERVEELLSELDLGLGRRRNKLKVVCARGLALLVPERLVVSDDGPITVAKSLGIGLIIARGVGRAATVG